MLKGKTKEEVLNLLIEPVNDVKSDYYSVDYHDHHLEK